MVLKNKPTKKPAKKPAVKPTKKPAKKPTKKPAKKPAVKPTKKPTKKPAVKPTKKPVVKPTKKPVVKPTKKPAVKPTKKPVVKPTKKPINKKKTITNKNGGNFFKGLKRNIQRYRYRTTNNRGAKYWYSRDSNKKKLELEKDLRYYIEKYNVLNIKSLVKLEMLYGKDHEIFNVVKLKQVINHNKNQFLKTLNTLKYFESADLYRYMTRKYKNNKKLIKKKINDYYDIAIYEILVNDTNDLSKLTEKIDQYSSENSKKKNRILLKLGIYLEKMKNFVHHIYKTIKMYNNSQFIDINDIIDDIYVQEISRKLYNTIYIYAFIIQMYNHCHNGKYILDNISKEDNQLFKHIDNKYKDKVRFIKYSKCYNFNDLTNNLINNSDENSEIQQIYYEEWFEDLKKISKIIVELNDTNPNPVAAHDSAVQPDTDDDKVVSSASSSSHGQTPLLPLGTPFTQFNSDQIDAKKEILVPVNEFLKLHNKDNKDSQDLKDIENLYARYLDLKKDLPNEYQSNKDLTDKFNEIEKIMRDNYYFSSAGGKKKQKKQKKPKKDKSKKTKKEKSRKDKKK